MTQLEFKDVIDNCIRTDIEELLKLLGFDSSFQIDELVGCASHRVFKITTSDKSFMIKQLSPVMLANPYEINFHIMSQKIAKYMSQNGINTVLSYLNIDKDPLFLIHGFYYMIYDWLPLSIVDYISEVHCFKIGQILSTIHSIIMPNTVIKGDIREENYRRFSLDELKQLSKESFISMVRAIIIENKAFGAYTKISNNRIISHCDLSIKNVLWKQQCPIIIDWDAAGYISKEKDIIQTLLSWCLKDNKVQERLVKSFFKGYFSKEGIIDVSLIKTAYYSVFLEDIEFIQNLIAKNKYLADELNNLWDHFKKSKDNISIILSIIADLASNKP